MVLHKRLEFSQIKNCFYFLFSYVHDHRSRSHKEKLCLLYFYFCHVERGNFTFKIFAALLSS